MYCPNCKRDIQGAGDGCDNCGLGYIDDPTPENEIILTLKDNRQVKVQKMGARGMAGEPFIWLDFIDQGGNKHSFTELEVKDLLSDKDKEWLGEWLDDIEKTNYNAAIRYSQ
jgi:hypothetical protein